MQNRRTFLKASGVSLALPFLESLHGATPPQPPKRLCYICTKLGLYSPSLFPEAPGPLTPSTDYLIQLKDYFSAFTLITGLSHEKQAGRLSHSSELTWLTAASNPGFDGFKNTLSVDQYAAAQLGYVTRFPSIVLSSAGQSSQSYTQNGVMIPAEDSPARLFTRLFLKGSPREILAQRNKLEFQQSILDGLMSQTKTLARSVSRTDREKLESYLESVRQTEKDIAQAGLWLTRPMPKTSVSRPEDVQDKSDLAGRVQLMMGMIPLILQSDASRVINLGIQVDHGVIKMDGINEEHHSLSHHGPDPAKIEKLKQVESVIIKAFAKLLADLSKPENVTADGKTLLDHTSLLFGSNLGNANIHDYRNLPLMLAGGGFKHGNFIAYDQKNNLPLSNLFLTMLHNTGIFTPSFAKSTARLSLS